MTDRPVPDAPRVRGAGDQVWKAPANVVEPESEPEPGGAEPPVEMREVISLHVVDTDRVRTGRATSETT